LALCAACRRPLAPSLSGTTYRWYGNTDATANSNRFAEPKLNDNSVSVDLSLAGDVYPDGRDNYEARVFLPQASTITSKGAGRNDE